MTSQERIKKLKKTMLLNQKDMEEEVDANWDWLINQAELLEEVREYSNWLENITTSSLHEVTSTFLSNEGSIKTISANLRAIINKESENKQ